MPQIITTSAGFVSEPLVVSKPIDGLPASEQFGVQSLLGMVPASVYPHNEAFVCGCDASQCELNEDAEYHSMSNEDEAIYEIYYTNPIKCCRVIVEIGAGDGERFSTSHFFEEGLKWKSLLIEANPILYEQAKENRPNATVLNAGFCESDNMWFEDGNFAGNKGPEEIMSEPYIRVNPTGPDTKSVKCTQMDNVFFQLGITHVDIMVIRLQGDPLAVIRAMDWTVRVDIWIVLANGGQRSDRDQYVRDVLLRNDYVAAEWDIKRWCPPTIGHCLNNEVFLRKGFDPLPSVMKSLRGAMKKLK